MATAQVMKATSEIKDGAHPSGNQPGAYVTLMLNPCPSRYQENQLGYSEQHKRDKVFVIRYFHRSCEH